MSENLKRKIPIVLLLIFWIAFIFYNSLQPGHISGASSGIIVNAIDKGLRFFKIEVDINALSIIVRKGAHVFEFFVLGILFFVFYENFIMLHRLTLTAFSSLFVAIIDETIQLFVDGRSGSVVDVGIDFIGVLLAIGLSLLVIKINKKNYD